MKRGSAISWTGIITIFFILYFIQPKSLAQCYGSLVWSDEFNGSSLDLTKWSYQTGNGCPSLCGWGNSELEYYTTSTSNVNVTGGNLVLTVLPQVTGSSSFTSGKIVTLNNYSWTYGRFEASIRMPIGAGLWPAFWMLPVVDNWPTTGEIDITEYRGDNTSCTSGTLHYGNLWPNDQYDGTTYCDTTNLGNVYHLYAVEWDVNEIRFYFDGRITKIETRIPNSLNPASNNANVWPWNTNFYIILNLAVGGWFTGVTTAAGVVLTKPTMEIDYVRVWDMTAAAGSEWPFNGSPTPVPAPIPGIVQAEEYDRTCAEAAYYDTDLPNNGGAFRGEMVDIETTTDIGGGYDVGWIVTNEYLKYTVNVVTSGTYNFNFRIASNGGGGALHVEMDGTNVTGTVNIPNTGSWTNWQTVTLNTISLTAGNHVMRVFIENGGFNLNYINFALVTPLPITLLDFSAKNQDGATILQWTTIAEKNNNYFTIERSSDLIHWEDLVEIKSQGNSESIKNYEWNDYTNKFDKAYYRLKQTDINDTSTYSKIIEVEAPINVQVSPNPFTDQVSITSTSEISGELDLCDITGNIVQKITLNKQNSTLQFGADLTKGIYLLKLQNGKTYKLIKQ
ncbi:MAG TPA: carbohydrate-binding protein [Cytophagaceae bacterium]|jgi:beta-glucanase (GH16 family)|nr:carbohydrate-binding protein [Cytophagaceae bacterium]